MLRGGHKGRTYLVGHFLAVANGSKRLTQMSKPKFLHLR